LFATRTEEKTRPKQALSWFYLKPVLSFAPEKLSLNFDLFKNNLFHYCDLTRKKIKCNQERTGTRLIQACPVICVWKTGIKSLDHFCLKNLFQCSDLRRKKPNKVKASPVLIFIETCAVICVRKTGMESWPFLFELNSLLSFAEKN